MKLEGRARRHKRVRKKVIGTAQRPRLSVFRSLGHIYVQLIDDENSKTMLSVSTRSKDCRGEIKYGGNVAAAKAVGKMLGEKALNNKITDVVFDRGGYLYHGRIKALADAAREAGLKF
ncbi:MAG: 50S ribosomal protein L18 [bacterium]|nr:50S ribosomal protein L18 [bacterium]